MVITHQNVLKLERESSYCMMLTTSGADKEKWCQVEASVWWASLVISST